MSEALANLVRARLKNGKSELNEHDLYKLGLLSPVEHDTVSCPACSKKIEAAITKRFYVIRHRDGDYFLRTGPSKYSQTDNILQATQFDDNLLQGLADSIKRQYWAQVLEQGSEIVEVRLSYVARKVADI